MAKKKKSSKPKSSKMRVIYYIVGFILLIVILSFAAVLFILGMLPSFVASYIDRTQDRSQCRVVAACNFSGVMPYIVPLFKGGEITSDAVNKLLFDPTVWLVMYGAAGAGWFLVWFFPQAVHFFLNLVQDSSVGGLRTKQQQIVDEWGLEVETTSKRALRNAMFAEERRNNSDSEEE
jgi:hypothetical protein